MFTVVSVLWAIAGIAFFFFVGIGIMNLLKNKATLGDNKGREELTRLNSRLDEMDRRLTDIQDVMLAINDKLEQEQWAGNKAQTT